MAKKRKNKRMRKRRSSENHIMPDRSLTLSKRGDFVTPAPTCVLSETSLNSR